jgi:hypothetical protein
MIRCLFAALAVLLLGCGPARAEPPMWVVEDADSTLLIFGSFHLLPRGVAWRPKALDRALQEADDLWLEVAMDQPVNGAAQSQVAARGALPPGRTLSSMLSKDGARRLALIAGQAGMPVDRLDRLQPWLAETLLGVAVYRQQGALAEEGVEQQIAKTAPAGVRQVALESAGERVPGAFPASVRGGPRLLPAPHGALAEGGRSRNGAGGHRRTAPHRPRTVPDPDRRAEPCLGPEDRAAHGGLGTDSVGGRRRPPVGPRWAAHHAARPRIEGPRPPMRAKKPAAR